MEPELEIAKKPFMLRTKLGLTQQQLARLDTLQQIAGAVGYNFEVKFVPQTTMNEDKRATLETAGWKVRTTKEFLDLSLEETEIVETRLQVMKDYLVSETERKEVCTKLAELEVKQHYLVKYKSSWADEMDIYGLHLLTDLDKKWFESLTPTDNKPFVHHVGTNEDIEYTNSKTFLEAYTWIPITIEEHEVLKKLIGTDYGHFFYPELIEEDEEW